MDPHRSMSHLFAQLGLSDEVADIQAFIATHRPIAHDIALHEAAFWSSVQAEFLRVQIEEDADWAVIVDKLDSALRRTSD